MPCEGTSLSLVACWLPFRGWNTLCPIGFLPGVEPPAILSLKLVHQLQAETAQHADAPAPYRELKGDVTAQTKNGSKPSTETPPTNHPSESSSLNQSQHDKTDQSPHRNVSQPHQSFGELLQLGRSPQPKCFRSALDMGRMVLQPSAN